MCGIVAYLGNREAWPLVLEGLQRLEYRGYDSAGIAILTPAGQLELYRSVGKVSGLAASVNGKIPQGRLGIGHTRWATHGRPSVDNAHPHTDCHHQIAVIHNGIVENFMELKRGLLGRGHCFVSETDTEVIPHLIEEGLKQGEDFEQSFRQLATLLRGANVVVAAWQGDPERLFGLRLGNAGGITVASKDGETVLGSDLAAVLPFSNQVVFVEDGDVVVATRDGVHISGADGTKVTRKPHVVPHDAATVGKEGYRHFMLKEIMEQPQAVSSALRGAVDFERSKVVFDGFPLSQQEVVNLRRIILTGCGTSLHAAMVGRWFIEELAQIPAEADSASELRYRSTPIDPRTLVVSVGQSGETADTLAAMEAAKAKGGRLITICNVEGSQATRLAEATLYMRSGLEIGVASTKTFTASLTILALLALYLGQCKGTVDSVRSQKVLAELAALPNVMGRLLANHRHYQTIARRYYKYDHFLYLGRGVDFPIAQEGALKLKEISYIHAEGYPAGEMKHGPIALIDDTMATVAIAPSSPLYSKMVNNVKEIKARDGVVIGVLTEGDKELAAEVDEPIYIPPCSELMTPFLTVIPLQLLAYYVALQRGCDVDQPRNLAKSVTVE